MKVAFLGQLAGSDTAATTLSTELGSGDFTRLRFMVAFTRWSGLHLLNGPLQAFATTPGTTIEGVCGVDLGGTTAEALTYLLELPGAAIKIFRSGNPRIVFHPKMYLLDGPERWIAIVGSSNLTAGGLHSNAEASLMLEGRVGRDVSPAEGYWADIWGSKPPLNSTHVQLLDATSLAALAPHLDAYTENPPDAGSSGASAAGITPLTLSVPLPAVTRPPVPAQRPSARRRPISVRTDSGSGGITPPSGDGVLYMELWEETGGGTQVQISKEAFETYFGASATTTTYVELSTPLGRDRVRLQAFSNDTFRIPLTFVRSTSRPAVLRFQRIGLDAYKVEVRAHSRSGYSTWLSRCTTRRNPTSKAYGMS